MCALAYYDELGQVWQFLERYFKAQLPLRDIAWRTPTPLGTTGSTLVTISTLPVQALAHDHPVFRKLANDRPNDYRAPYAHLNLVVCETSDAYKSAVKAKVKAWVEARTEKQEEWLLMYVPLGTQNNTHDMYVKIYTKMAADFCMKAPGDRSCMLTVFEQGVSMGGTGPAGPSGVVLQQNHQEQWGDVMTKIKAVVGNAFVARSKAYQERVRELQDETTAAAGVGADFFFKLFFAKEKLALMNEQFQLPGEALHHYQELSALSDHWHAALEPAGGTSVPDSLVTFHLSSSPSLASATSSALPLLDYSVAEFRGQVEAGGREEEGKDGARRVGPLHVQQYLFAREAGFLLHLARYSELLRRTQRFIMLQHQTLVRLCSSSTARDDTPTVAHLWALAASWAVLQAWEDFLLAQQQAQPPPLPALLSSVSSPCPTSLQPIGAPLPEPSTPPPLANTQRASVAASSGHTPSKVILLETGLLERHLAELLDFCRVRAWDLGVSLLGSGRLREDSVVYAAHREAMTDPASLPPMPSTRPEAGATPVSGDMSFKSGCQLIRDIAGGDDTGVQGPGRGSHGSFLEGPRHVVSSPTCLFECAAPWIRSMFSSVSAFDQQYLRMTEVLVLYLEKGGRDRFAGRVQAERASILMQIGDWEEARRLVRRLAEQNYRKDYWLPLLSHLLRQLAQCEKERRNAKAYVGTMLQIVSLRCLDEATEALYLAYLEEFVRNHLTAAAGSPSCLARPLSLLVTARIKAAPRDLAPVTRTPELWQPASVVIWLHLAIARPLIVDGLELTLSETGRLLEDRRLGADYSWIAASSRPPGTPTPKGLDGPVIEFSSPSPGRKGDSVNCGKEVWATGNGDVSHPSRAPEDTATGLAEYLLWRVPGPVTLEPGVNELTLTAASVPPPGAYVFERLALQWGGLLLEQEQLSALDDYTLDAITTNCTPLCRSPSLVKAPTPRAVGLNVAPKPPVTSLVVLTSPIFPPDSHREHHLSILIDTNSDTLNSPTLSITQPALKALKIEGFAMLALYPQRLNSDGQEEEMDDVPFCEEEVKIAWDGSTATLALPEFLPIATSLVLTLTVRPLPEVVGEFVRGRQDYQRLVSINVVLAAEFNKNGGLSPRRQQENPTVPNPIISPATPFARDKSADFLSQAFSCRTRGGMACVRRSFSIETGAWDRNAMDDAVRRYHLRASAEVVIQQPFSVTISVQACSHWRTSHRFFVQALLTNRAPLPATLHACHLRLPRSYRIVALDQKTDQTVLLRDLLLAPGQDVRYAYLIERVGSTGAGSLPGQPETAEGPSKMSVSADYTWETLRPINQARVRRHHPPQQQQGFERYFQDSAMLCRGDSLRTFVVRAQLVPAASPSSAEEGRGTALAQGSPHQLHLLPACAPATPGDVEERGVVVGHFQNRVAEGVVGAALRLELSVELSDEAAQEALLEAVQNRDIEEGTRGKCGFQLTYEVAADPADWAVCGATKGIIDIGPGPDVAEASPVEDIDAKHLERHFERTVSECKLVPVRPGLLACPALTFEPLKVRAAISPRSVHKSNVRWVGPRDILVVSPPGLQRIPTVRLS